MWLTRDAISTIASGCMVYAIMLNVANFMAKIDMQQCLAADSLKWKSKLAEGLLPGLILLGLAGSMLLLVTLFLPFSMVETVTLPLPDFGSTTSFVLYWIIFTFSFCLIWPLMEEIYYRSFIQHHLDQPWIDFLVAFATTITTYITLAFTTSLAWLIIPILAINYLASYCLSNLRRSKSVYYCIQLKVAVHAAVCLWMTVVVCADGVKYRDQRTPEYLFKWSASNMYQ